MTRINNPRSTPPPTKRNPPKITRQRAKTMTEDQEYNALRDVYLRENPQCCWCMSRATQVHHIVGGVNRRKTLANSDTWLPVCAACHEVVAAFSTRTQCYIKHETTDRAIERGRT